MDTSILKAEPEDAPAILALQKNAYLSEALIYDGIDLPPMTQTLEGMRQDMRIQTVLKAVADGRIVGSVRAEQENGICKIGRLIVEPALQGKGLGTRLMAAIENAFPDADAWELFTGEKSVKNLKFYQRLGYKKSDAREVMPGLTLVFLTKMNSR